MNAKEQTKNKINYLQQLILPLILLLYPLRNINQGVDISDTTYNIGNYGNLEILDRMWYFATYLTQQVGSLLTELPYGNTMIGINFYSSLFISAIALISYFFLSKKIPYGIVFVGEIIAISLCWCPSVILYNYITYLLFTAGAILLYQGLIKEKRTYLCGAGICLGLNVMTRFPNVLEAALILALWYYGWLNKKKIGEILKETGICVGGYLAGIGSVLTLIIFKFGFDDYIEGIADLFLMNKTATSYTPKEMILSVIREYLINVKWLLGMIIVVFAGLVGFYIWKRIIKNRKYDMIPKAIYILLIMVLVRWYYAKGMFNLKYYTYESMKMWAAVFLIIAIVFNLWLCFTKKRPKEENLAGLMILIIIGITPLGSNNYLYPNYNNLFLVAPITLFFIWNILKNQSKFTPYWVKSMMGMMVALFLIQGVGFGLSFVYRDGMFGEKRDTKVENNDILKGMYTNSENAEVLEGIQSYLEKENLIDKEVILYGDIPGLAYILEMQTAISSTWPDLDSYQLETFKEELRKVQGKIEQERPVFIINREKANRIDQALNENAKIEEVKEESKGIYDKLDCIREFLIENSYEKGYSNNRFVVYK